LPVDQRNYGMGAQILNDIGVHQFCLITNNPRKIAGLKGYGLEMVDRVPLIIEATPYNSHYLETKAQKLGHLLLQTYLVTISIQTKEDFSAISAKYEQLEKVRQLAQQAGFFAQEEVRSVAVALLGQGKLIVNLGMETLQGVKPGWYNEEPLATWRSLAKILDELVRAPNLEQLEMIVSDGADPFSHLQVGLSRQVFSIGPGQDTLYPSGLQGNLQTQRIYIFSRHNPND
ncbi:MAG: bifunctional 3,4-dihydroxy-2-butanone-4-phosphate synthase/GTP cyclohydrolase II, partial [Cyanobacteria bacterium P01_C01_bin.147]